MDSNACHGEFGSDGFTSPPSVLVAEDNEDIRELVSHQLRRMGILVLLAEDGRRALDLALAERPALVLMDMDMPVMSGFDAVAALRAQGLSRVDLRADRLSGWSRSGARAVKWVRRPARQADHQRAAAQSRRAGTERQRRRRQCAMSTLNRCWPGSHQRTASALPALTVSVEKDLEVLVQRFLARKREDLAARALRSQPGTTRPSGASATISRAPGRVSAFLSCPPSVRRSSVPQSPVTNARWESSSRPSSSSFRACA